MTADGHIKADRGSHEWCWTCMVEWPCPATKEATLQAELVRLREQADALADACKALDELDWCIGYELLTHQHEQLDKARELARVALRAYRETSHE